MKDTLALVAIMKNEGTYLLEWIAHYRLIGVRNIIIYDNDTADPGREMLEKLAASGLITLHKWTVEVGISPQLSAYADALLRYRDAFEFLAFFDADEFLVQKTSTSITRWLPTLPADVGAIAINQRVFGSSGHRKRGAGLVVARFQLAAEPDYDENRWVKSIYRSSSVEVIGDCHRGKLKSGKYILPNRQVAFSDDNATGKAEQIDYSLFQLNHYIIKSEEEFLIKRQRGGGMGHTQAARLKRYEDLNFFRGRDMKINASRDDQLGKSVAEIQAEIGYLEQAISAVV
ncbi:hypothetical protein ACH79_15955 [Bradyrhizobium sp. CCBAU 051011]|uniref:glycosyltransferase family 92 protein n=1 Tax=Bradyrhizobium sp. CCBAU 051011 TaxID=858422 RepID=UPI00137420E6|nr:glycosyltransferase family 92 protein [Bradyrhizobium sp. CCBAU 051011]QHO73912.1 hypothetical protein ACH79_15955 [Bradyrhizobium sp. CCBAU 051011]